MAALNAGSYWNASEVAAKWAAGQQQRDARWSEFTELLVDLAGVGPGHRVLDVAAGSGDQTLVAARRAGPNGSVLATDISPGMLDALTNIMRGAGFGNVETLVADAAKLDLPPDSFDAAICRNGLQWIPARHEALTAIHHALRPGAKFAALVHGAPERNAYAVLGVTIVRRHAGLPPLTPDDPQTVALGPDGVLAAAFERAGFRDVTIHPIAIPRVFPSAAAVADELWTAGGVVPALLARMTEAQRTAAKAEVEAAFRAYEGPDGVDLTSQSLIGVGTK